MNSREARAAIQLIMIVRRTSEVEPPSVDSLTT